MVSLAINIVSFLIIAAICLGVALFIFAVGKWLFDEGIDMFRSAAERIKKARCQ